MSYPKDPSDPKSARTTYRYRPQNQVDPQISSNISLESDGRYHYRYAVKNGAAARQSIDIWYIVGPGTDADLRVEQPSWGKVWAKGSKAKQVALPPGAPDGQYLEWASGGRAISPGGSEKDFVVVSNYRPGFTTAYAVSGHYLSFRGDGPPPEVAQQLVPLMRPEVNMRSALTLGPRYPLSVARSVVVADYRAVIQQLAKTKAITDLGFLASVTKLLDDCGASETKRCVDDEGAVLLKTAVTSLERETATALLLALK